MKRIMDEGGLIPYQLTVQVLVNGMIANPSKVSYPKNDRYRTTLSTGSPVRGNKPNSSSRLSEKHKAFFTSTRLLRFA